MLIQPDHFLFEVLAPEKKEAETERQSLNALEQVLIQKRLIKHRLVEERITQIENGDDRDKISRTVERLRAENRSLLLVMRNSKYMQQTRNNQIGIVSGLGAWLFSIQSSDFLEIPNWKYV